MEGMEHTSNADLRTAADTVLARLVGDPSGTARLRDDQWRAIEALVAERRRALVVQRTGWGKSACTSWPPPCCANAAPDPR